MQPASYQKCARGQAEQSAKMIQISLLVGQQGFLGAQQGKILLRLPMARIGERIRIMAKVLAREVKC